jgi:RNA polymerase sigma factor (sigma-70 family)
MHEPDDAQLVQRTLAGDHRAFAELLCRHQDSAVNLARRMVGNRSDGEDVAQESFLRAFRHLQRFDPARGFRPWLLGITANLARNHIRGRWRRKIREEALPAPEDNVPQDPRLAALDEALAALDPSARAILTLKYMEGFSLEDISRSLGIRNSAVKMRLARARGALLNRCSSLSLDTP